MIRPAFRDALLGRSLTALRTIWVALIAAVLVDVAVALWITLTRPPLGASDIAATVTPFLYAVALGAAVLAQWWRRFLAPERLLAAPSPTPRTGALRMTPENESERRAHAAFGLLQKQSIIMWALAAAIALCGFVVSILTGNPRHVFALAVGALVLLGANAPTRARFEGVLTALARR